MKSQPANYAPIIDQSKSSGKIDLSNLQPKIKTENLGDLFRYIAENCSDIRSINLSNNVINQITESDFKLLNGLRNLQEINLSNNKIGIIEDIFYHLPNLNVINLSNNPIQKIDNQVFETIKNRNFQNLDLQLNLKGKAEINLTSFISALYFYSQLLANDNIKNIKIFHNSSQEFIDDFCLNKEHILNELAANPNITYLKNSELFGGNILLALPGNEIAIIEESDHKLLSSLPLGYKNLLFAATNEDGDILYQNDRNEGKLTKTAQYVFLQCAGLQSSQDCALIDIDSIKDQGELKLVLDKIKIANHGCTFGFYRKNPFNEIEIFPTTAVFEDNEIAKKQEFIYKFKNKNFGKPITFILLDKNIVEDQKIPYHLAIDGKFLALKNIKLNQEQTFTILNPGYRQIMEADQALDFLNEEKYIDEKKQENDQKTNIETIGKMMEDLLLRRQKSSDGKFYEDVIEEYYQKVRGKYDNYLKQKEKEERIRKEKEEMTRKEEERKKEEERIRLIKKQEEELKKEEDLKDPNEYIINQLTNGADPKPAIKNAIIEDKLELLKRILKNRDFKIKNEDKQGAIIEAFTQKAASLAVMQVICDNQRDSQNVTDFLSGAINKLYDSKNNFTQKQQTTLVENIGKFVKEVPYADIKLDDIANKASLNQSHKEDIKSFFKDVQKEKEIENAPSGTVAIYSPSTKNTKNFASRKN